MSSYTAKLPRRIGSSLVLGAVAALMVQPAALAHVGISPDTAAAGEHATVSFRVPNERENTSTVRFEVVLPDEQPMASVSPKALPGWTVATRTVNVEGAAGAGSDAPAETVAAIVWEGGEILPGQFEVFPVRMGPFPEEGTALVFRAVQTYSDGEVVRWIDVEEPGQPEPEHPAPSLSVRPVASTQNATEESTEDTLARAAGGTGLVAGAAALVVAALRGRRSRSTQQ